MDLRQYRSTGVLYVYAHAHYVYILSTLRPGNVICSNNSPFIRRLRFCQKVSRPASDKVVSTLNQYVMLCIAPPWVLNITFSLSSFLHASQPPWHSYYRISRQRFTNFFWVTHPQNKKMFNHVPTDK
jgi:hypothetical protein